MQEKKKQCPKCKREYYNLSDELDWRSINRYEHCIECTRSIVEADDTVIKCNHSLRSYIREDIMSDLNYRKVHYFGTTLDK